MAVCGKVVDGNSLSVHVTEVAQPLEEPVKSRLRRSRIKIKRKEAKSRDIFRLLRVRGERPSDGSAAKKDDELTSLHELCPQAEDHTLPHR